MSNTGRTVKTTFCLVSDTHDRAPFPADETHWPFREPLPSADVFLHAGDLTMIGGLQQYRRVLDWIKSVDAELKIVIAGNHDIDLHEEYYLKNSGERPEVAKQQMRDIKELWTGPETRDVGVVYLDEGLSTFQLKSGAVFTIYTSPWQPEFCDWAFNYPRDNDRWNAVASSSEPAPANPIPSWPAVDIVLTHGPPHGILDRTDRDEPVGCEFLRTAMNRARPRLQCSGHIHEAYGALKINWEKNTTEKAVPIGSNHLPYSSDGPEPLIFGQETIFVNASIMNLNYRPVNAPWLVDLDLPTRAEG